MSGTKFFIRTFGCRCNQADSAAIREGLCRKRMVECTTASDADIIIVNTCTVTRRSDQQARQSIRSLHRKNPQARIIVTGCYAEREARAISEVAGVALVVGNADRDRLADVIGEGGLEADKRIIWSPLDGRTGCPVLPMGRTGGKTRPLVKLQDGCDARCSYCIVPKVRGPGRSARPEDVLGEISSLIDQGYQEIVLTGVHLGTYGRKFKPPVRLADLLRRIIELPGLGRIRLSSIEPMLFDRRIVSLAAESKAFAHHFHIPLQSGSDRVLRRMRRPYKVSRFRDLVRYIREEIPDAGIGTDVLTGFPGESEDDFAETCELLRELPLGYLHVFPFSAREGTEAFAMVDAVPADDIKRRSLALLEIAKEKSLAFRRQFVGSTLPAITLSKDEEGGAGTLLTGNYIHVKAPVRGVGANRLVDVRIEEARPDATLGRIIPFQESP